MLIFRAWATCGKTPYPMQWKPPETLTLTLNDPVTATVTSCMSRLGQINRVKHCFDNRTLILIINALVIITNGKKRWMVSWKRKIKKNTEFRASVGRNWNPELRIILCEYSFGMHGSQYGVPFGDRFRRRHFCYELLKQLYQQIQKKATNFGLSVSGNYGLTKFFTKLGQRTREVLVAHVAAGRDHHVRAYWGLGGERSASPREWRPRRQNLTLAPCKGFEDSLEFWIQCRGFRILGTGFQSSSVKLGIWIPIILGFQIPWAVFRIPKLRIPPFHKHEFPGFRNSDSLTGEPLTITLATQAGQIRERLSIRLQNSPYSWVLKYTVRTNS